LGKIDARGVMDQQWRGHKRRIRRRRGRGRRRCRRSREKGGQATKGLGREGWRGKGGWWAAVGGEVAASRGVVVEADGGGVEDEEEGRGCELQIRWRTHSRREEDEVVAGEGRPTGGWWIVQV
jgi:hypothetical protein